MNRRSKLVEFDGAKYEITTDGEAIPLSGPWQNNGKFLRQAISEAWDWKWNNGPIDAQTNEKRRTFFEEEFAKLISET